MQQLAVEQAGMERKPGLVLQGAQLVFDPIEFKCENTKVCCDKRNYGWVGCTPVLANANGRRVAPTAACVRSG
jgi:hypothetical protein